MEGDSRIPELIKLCENSGDVYIYGAGVYGEYCYTLLNYYSIKVTGFIVTKPEWSVYLGRKVLSIQEYRFVAKEDDVVIPGFMGCTKRTLEFFFCDWITKPIVFDISANEIKQSLVIRYLTDLRDYLCKEYPLKSSETNSWRNILVIRLDAIGDIVCTTAFIRELRLNYPYANITIVINKGVVDILENCPYINEIVEYNPMPYFNNVYATIDYKGIIDNVERNIPDKIRNISYDVAFLCAPIMDGKNSLDSLMYAVLSGAKNRIGFCYGEDPSCHYLYNFMTNFFSTIVFLNKPLHEVEYQLEMMRNIGLSVNNEKTELWINRIDKVNVKKRMIDDGVELDDFIIGVGIVGSAPRRCWNPEYYNTLFNSMERISTHVKWILLGGINAVEASNKIKKSNSVIDYTGKLELRESIACLSMCDMYVGSNTGLMHIADALDKPCITIYSALKDVSPWDPDGPTRFGARNTLHVDLLPDPGLDGCYGSCKMKTAHCINQITPKQVRDEIVELMHRKGQCSG